MKYIKTFQAINESNLNESKLIDEKTGKVVKLPYKTKDFRGDPITVKGFTDPHKSSSSGRIQTDKGEYFPGVAGVKIVGHKFESVEVNEESSMKAIIKAPKGAIASGGGHSPWTKMGKNSWKNKKTGSLAHDAGLYDRIGEFSDFIIEGNENELTEALARGLKPLLKIGSTITKKVGEDALLDLSDKFDRIDDEYAGTIASWLDMAIELMQDGYAGDATKKLKQFNKACKDVLNGKDIGSAFESVNEAKKFKPGDKWSNDFDYEGMLKYALKVNEKTPIKTLNNLFDSATDVNYHTPFANLGIAIDWIEDGDKAGAKDYIKMFHHDIKKEMKG